VQASAHSALWSSMVSKEKMSRAVAAALWPTYVCLCSSVIGMDRAGKHTPWCAYLVFVASTPLHGAYWSSCDKDESVGFNEKQDADGKDWLVSHCWTPIVLTPERVWRPMVRQLAQVGQRSTANQLSWRMPGCKTDTLRSSHTNFVC
jgi:hypothetical protein